MHARTGPSLPRALLDELETQAGDGRTHKHKPGNRQLSRKEARRQQRHEQKQRKTEFFASSHRPSVKRHAEREHPESPQRKKVRRAPEGSGSKPESSSSAWSDRVADGDGKAKPNLQTTPSVNKSNTSESKRARPELPKTLRSSSRSALPAPAPRSRQEEEEDAYIAYLESKLGWRKGGRRTARYGKGGDDGLDELLDDLDVMESSVFGPPPKGRADGVVAASDGEQDEDSVTEDEDEEDSSAASEGDPSAEEDGDGDGDGEEWTGFGDLDDVQNPPTANPAPSAVTATQAPAAGSRYVPPHLRNRDQGANTSETEAQIKLKRQLKGLLNRMSEQNIASIIDGVEETYRNHRRHDVTSTLTTLIIDGISSHSMLLDSYVVLHAAFVSALHKLVGVEFAAYFVQNVIATYERHFTELQQSPEVASSMPNATQQQAEEEIKGKECSNLIVLLSELYNFQVISCVLVYDIIQGLLGGDLAEFKVELLLKITRNSGCQLRQDDPTALKSIIQIVQSKLPAEPNAMSSRTRFMVETLTNLKNNKLKRNAAPTAEGDTVERLKKFLSGLSKKRHVLSHEPLRVSLEDLHSAESKGKWWLVGAAWGGDPLVEYQESQREAAAKTEADALSDNTLLKLARKQGMNTEIRRGIFVVLMSSEDYVDACERLSQLKLTEVQQREIVRVILHCCGNEKMYNPYYSLVGQQLCRTSHSHRFTLQYCLWDFLRDLGETNVGGAEVIKNLGEDSGFDVKNISSARMRNVARAYGWWIAKDCCTLAILKPVDFTVLKGQTRTFLKELLIQVFVSTQVATPLLSGDSKDLPTTRNRGVLEEVFIKATRVQTLVIGLVYFVGDVFKGQDEEHGFLKWASEVVLDTLRTGVDVAAGL